MAQEQVCFPFLTMEEMNGDQGGDKSFYTEEQEGENVVCIQY